MKNLVLDYDEMNEIEFCLLRTYLYAPLEKKEAEEIKLIIDKLKENRIKPNEIIITEIVKLPL